jgi:CheY-like chemotaxis protein
MGAISGKRILLVEDEAIIAFAAEDMLMELGCEVVGPALRLEDALSLAAGERIDAAILDVNLNAVRSYPVAEELERRSIPFVFATGYDRHGLDWRGVPAEVVSKPYRRDQVEAALARAIQGRAGAIR